MSSLNTPATEQPVKPGIDWIGKYKEKPTEFLNWYKGAMNNGYQWGNGNEYHWGPWGGKNEKETVDIMAKELLPNLKLHDIQETYKDIYGQKDWYSSWLAPQLSRATADEFRGQGFQQDALKNFRSKVMGDLAQSSKDTSLDMYRRGLGKGGMAQGAQAKLAAGASKDMAQGKQDISRESESMAQEVEANHLNSAIQVRNMQQQANNNVYNSALQSYMAKKQGSKQLMGMAGMGAGFALGGPGGAMIGGQAGGML